MKNILIYKVYPPLFFFCLAFCTQSLSQSLLQGTCGELPLSISDVRVESNVSVQSLPIPDLIYPVDNAVDVEITPKFIMRTVTEANRYELQVATDENFSNMISNSYWQFEQPYPMEYLEWFSGIREMKHYINNKVYYWRARVVNTETNVKSSWTSVHSYQTRENGGYIASPQLDTPIDKINIPWLELPFKWHPVDNCTWYQVQYSSDNNFNSFSYQWVNKEKAIYITNVKPGTKYYWKVIAFSGSSISEFSESRTFATNTSILLDKNEYTFTDGSLFDNYPSSSEFHWLIKPQNQKNITLSFLSIDTEADYDIITVYDGDNINAPVLEHFSGDQIPIPITSTGASMLIKFKTDWLSTKSGWKARYTTGEKIPVIFIPGIMGSPLYNDLNLDGHLTSNERIWVRFPYYNILNPHTYNILDPLQLDESGQNPFHSGYNIKVSPIRGDEERTIFDELDTGPIHSNTNKPLNSYSGLIQGLIESPNYYKLDNFDNNTNENENLFIFTYDWRKTNIHNGALLKAFIENVLAWTSADKVNIICHSMGGFVAKSCVNQMGTGKDKIKKLIFIATPHMGAPRAFYTALSGNILDLKQLLVSSRSKIMEISRNFPSVYELFPSPSYSNISYNNKISQKNNLYNENFINESTPLFYTDINDFFKNVNEGKTFNSYLIDNSTLIHSDLEIVDFSGIEIYNIVGCNIPTIGKVIIREGKAIPNHNLNGDGTVPLKSAELINNNINTALNTFYIWSLYTLYDHQELTSSPPTLDIIAGLLKDPAFTGPFGNLSIHNTPPETYAGIPNILVLATGKVGIEIFDKQGRHTGFINDSTWEASIPGSIYYPGESSDGEADKGILVPHDLNYIIRVNSTGTQSHFNMLIDQTTDGTAVISQKFNEIPILENSIAYFIWDSTNILNGQLEVDIDNNGTTDSVYKPEVIVTSVEPHYNAAPPIEFNLEQSYPNPFNQSTVICFTIPIQTEIKLAVYDILGNEVAVLVNGSMPAGKHIRIFNAQNISSGIYFYRLQAGTRSQTRKFVLIK